MLSPDALLFAICRPWMFEDLLDGESVEVRAEEDRFALSSYSAYRAIPSGTPSRILCMAELICITLHGLPLCFLIAEQMFSFLRMKLVQFLRDLVCV